MEQTIVPEMLNSRWTHAENVADSAVQMTNDNVTFSKQGELDLSEMLDMVLKILDESIEMFAKNDLQHLQEIIDHMEQRTDAHNV